MVLIRKHARASLIVMTGMAAIMFLGAASCQDDDDEAAPPTAVASAFVGSQACGTCHSAIYASWLGSRHRWKVTLPTDPVPGFVCDSDKDGINDFKEGITIGNPANVPSNGTDFANVYSLSIAPVLGFNAMTGEYTMTIGPNTYVIKYLLGGNWKQRYMTQIGNSVYILPVQYNPAENKWVKYNEAKWYTNFTGAATVVYGAGQTPVTLSKQSDSWDHNCFGCHTTGITGLTVNESGEFVAEFTELSIGCEACHGPGRNHVALGGGVGTIVNPAKLALDREIEVCGQCHTRGFGKYEFTPGKKPEYPWSAANEPFRPGDNLDNFYTHDADTSASFWQDAAYSSKKHHQQYNDHRRPGTTSHVKAGVTCSGCHDPHNSGFSRETKLDSDNNDLCMYCHGFGTAYPIIVDWTTGATIGVTNDISGHTQHQVNPLEPNKPTAGNGSRCISCHMPFTAASGVSAGSYDIRSHHFTTLWPRESRVTGANATGRPNTCMTSTCHGPADISTTKWNTGFTDANCNAASESMTTLFGDRRPVVDAFAKTSGGTRQTTFTNAQSLAMVLDGTRSFDPNRTAGVDEAITYLWTQLSGPAVAIDSSATSTTTLNAAAALGPGTYVFELTVSDSAPVLSTSKVLTFTVTP